MEVKAVLCLFWIFVQRVSSLQESLENGEVVADSDVDFERLENGYAVGNVSTGSEAYQNTTSEKVTSVPMETATIDSDNATEFRPSVHLGEIEEFRSARPTNPFNKLSHLKFDNFFSVQEAAGAWNNVSPKNESIRPKKTNNDDDKKIEPTPNFFPTTSIPDENQYFRTQNSEAAFHRILPPFQAQNLNPAVFQNSLQLSPPFRRPEFSPNSPDQTTYFDTTYTQEVPQPFEHPGLVNDEVNFVTPSNDVRNFEYTKHPNFENFEEPNFLNIHHEIQEVSPTRNHRFPYKFYHETPTLHDGNIEYVAEEQVFNNVPRERKTSPWKKIIHLIGTILPFGLLLASLTPNIVRISNTTDPTIPLSKLKDLSLPPEHKSLRMIEDPGTCEEKNICELILAGSKPRSNLLQNILWNFVVRTKEKTAKDNGLRDLFQAVKNKDCNLITC